jgi:hypothetical protein
MRQAITPPKTLFDKNEAVADTCSGSGLHAYELFGMLE